MVKLAAAVGEGWAEEITEQKERPFIIFRKIILLQREIASEHFLLDGEGFFFSNETKIRSRQRTE